MTRSYAAIRLLEHGPLTFAEVRQITGWPPESVRVTLQHLQATGKVYAERVSSMRRRYRLN